MTSQYERIEEDDDERSTPESGGQNAPLIDQNEQNEIVQGSFLNSICVVIGLTLLPITGMVMAVIIYTAIQK